MLKFELTQEEANIVVKGLMELPVKISLAIIDKLQKQADKQLNPKKEPEVVRSEAKLEAVQS